MHAPIVLVCGMALALSAGVYGQGEACARASAMQTCLTEHNRNVLDCNGSSTCLCTRLKVRAACYHNCPGDATLEASRKKDTDDGNAACSGATVAVSSNGNINLGARPVGADGTTKAASSAVTERVDSLSMGAMMALGMTGWVAGYF